jgi:hypothetical protein
VVLVGSSSIDRVRCLYPLDDRCEPALCGQGDDPCARGMTTKLVGPTRDLRACRSRELSIDRYESVNNVCGKPGKKFLILRENADLRRSLMDSDLACKGSKQKRLRNLVAPTAILDMTYIDPS